MSARLVAEEGILKGLILPFEGGEEWIIGRDPDECQLVLEDPAASRKHLLARQTDAGIEVENLSDTNPVLVNDAELSGPRVLKEGDTVKIGSGIFRYFTDQPPVATSDENIAEAGTMKTSNEPELTPEIATDAEPAALAASSAGEGTHRDSILEEVEDTGKHRFAEINFDVVETGRWLLKVISGPNNGAEFSMQPGTTYLIGTDPNTCDIVFHDTSVSRQHARITISADDSIFVEDLKSRNKTLVDGDAINERVQLAPNVVVTTGTTSFVIYDREGNMQTIISPLLPSIVKVLQRDSKSDQKTEGEEAENTAPEAPVAAPPKEKPIGALILISIITGLFMIAAIGTSTLFKSEPLAVKESVDMDKSIADVLNVYPSIKYSFNKTTGRLVMFGHLLTAQDKTQLLYSLQGLPFIKTIDDSGVIIDEYVWQETNQVINKNPNWRAITIQSPTAGQFVLNGYLQTRKQAEQLYEYISSNFPYLDRLEKKVVVEEDIVNDVKSNLEKVGIMNTQVTYRNGEVIITGGVPATKQADYQHLLEEFKLIPGVRAVRSQVNPIAQEQSMINISDRYEVTGFSRIGQNISVIINGRIVTKGDVLDGMTIKEITPGTVFLQKDNVDYRIDFSK